ncbi:MAG: DUF177 domain-containing protein [Acidobacteria bacterium]|nr:DUF177 domain-containing protein [Acidobacteriota bacterium]
MLLIEVSTIPPEGLDLDEALEAAEVHLDGEDAFRLDVGGRLVCRLEKGDDQSVHVRGHLAAGLGLECGRCLEPFAFPVEQDLDLFYLPHRRETELMEQEDEVVLTDHDMVVAYYAENRLDLGEMVREQFFLTLPMKRLCRETCLGLCPTCGTNRNVAPCDCPEPPTDPRLAPLAKIFDKGSS